MCRRKTELEIGETPEQEAKRLRLALFYAYTANSFDDAKNICNKAMAGELHGHELDDLSKAYGQ